jgi:hypothetical protein
LALTVLMLGLSLLKTRYARLAGEWLQRLRERFRRPRLA